MKKFLLLCATLLLSVAVASSQPLLTKDNIPEVVKAMTIQEKALLLVGIQMNKGGFAGKYLEGTGGATYPFEKYGMPSIVLMDGPVGIRLSEQNRTTCFPTGLLSASSWDKNLVYTLGEAIGEECLDMGCDVILGPGMNLLRNPLNGRNFEYFSEDPVLCGQIAAAFVNGVQSKGVGTSAKHFAANNQETNRLDCDSRVSERALRELYLKAFEICIRESDPWTVMSSYNYLNGEYTQESHWLLTEVLRHEWGWNGLVMTDWTGRRNTPRQIHAGSDLLMGGNPSQTAHILESLENGRLSMSDLDLAVTRVLELIVKTPAFRGNKPSLSPDLKAHAQTARDAASEGMVLLKNNGVLPVSGCRAALYGVYSYDLIQGGNGAALVYSPYVSQINDAFASAGFSIDAKLEKLYKSYASFISEDLLTNHKVNVHLGNAQKPELDIDKSLIENTEKNSDIAFITFGRVSGEARDRIHDTDFLLQQKERALLENVCNIYHKAGKKVVVILNICGPMETASWKDLPDAILCAWLPGEEGGNAIADLVTGKKNPSGRLPMTFPVSYFDAAGSEDFPYDFVSNKANESVVHPERRGLPLKNIAFTDYTEGIYVGYRYFCTQNKPVSFPFGYGLSYTSFSYSKPMVKVKKGRVEASICVTNTGSVSGKEAVGLYIKAASGSFSDKPDKELKAFAKTPELAPGQSYTLTMGVPLSDLSSYNDTKARWERAKGRYKVYFGADVLNPEAESGFNL